MSIPGFNAGESLYKTRGRYRSFSSVQTGGVALQQSSLASDLGRLGSPLPAAGSKPSHSLLDSSIPLIGSICPPRSICCEFDAESRTCIGGCCAKAANCCPDGAPGPGNQCTNFGTDPANCGRCNNVCPPGTSCVKGICTPTTSCPSGLTLCGDVCVNLSNDSRNCSGCGVACAAGQSCVNGHCCTVCGQECCPSGAACVSGRDPSDPVDRTCRLLPETICDKAQRDQCDQQAQQDYQDCLVDFPKSFCNRKRFYAEARCNGRFGCLPGLGVCCPSGVCTHLDTTANCGSCGNACLAGQTCCGGVCCSKNCCSGVCCSLSCTSTVAAPGCLCSNSNYILDNGCQNILGLDVALQVTQDIRSDIGFTIQLNADSPAGTEVDAFQQYGFSITGNSIQGFINNWSNVSTQVVCDSVDLGSTPISNGIPAGYSLVLQLLNDNLGNVTGANYQVFDNNGVSRANSTFLVQDAGCQCGGTCLGFKQGDLSPITAFTVDIVGPGNGSNAAFSAGAGNIVYGVSSGNLTPLTFVPACIETDLFTAETSNASYGRLNGCPRPTITQQFSVALLSPPPPMCCPPGSTCSCGGRCVNLKGGGQACIDPSTGQAGQCLGPNQHCN